MKEIIVDILIVIIPFIYILGLFFNKNKNDEK